MSTNARDLYELASRRLENLASKEKCPRAVRDDIMVLLILAKQAMGAMTEARAREILDSMGTKAYDDFVNVDGHVEWQAPAEVADADGSYTPEHLEAIAWWMRNKKVVK